VPELPEVETIARQVRARLVGRTIAAVRLHWPGIAARPKGAALARSLVGAAITSVWRRGKFFVIDLTRSGEPAGHLVGHLRMSGRLYIEPSSAHPGPHTRATLALDDGSSLRFVDPRKFGRLWWVADVEEVLGSLGPEPLGSAFTRPWLAAGLRARRRSLKALLLDQTFVAGLGNIYTDEALHAAGLHPLRSSDSLDPAAAGRLHRAIRRVLQAAIRREGSSFDTFYRTPEGRPGGYQERFLVYGRTGKPCRGCGTAITRLVVAQRGTHICPRCQPRPRGR
jgi:formamidopyrimidine-DNA glycosylase